MKKFIPMLGLLLVLGFSRSMSQCLISPVSLQERISKTSLIVEGEVISSFSFWNSAHDKIYTAHQVLLHKLLNGNNPSDSMITILTEGGTVGLERYDVDPSPQLNKGDYAIFFCIRPGVRLSGYNVVRMSHPVYELYASVQGMIRIEDGEGHDSFRNYLDLNNELYAPIKNSTGHNPVLLKPYYSKSRNVISPMGVLAVTISSFSPTSLSAGTSTQLTINGSGFGSTRSTGSVSFANCDDGGSSYISPLDAQYISWSDTKIVVEVPHNAGTGKIKVTQGTTTTSASNLTVTYALSNISYDPGTGFQDYRPALSDDNGSGGFTLQMYTGFDSNASAKAAFTRSLETWQCGTGLNFSIGSTTSTDATASDGVNVVRFDVGSELSSGVLGLCTRRFTGCSSSGTIKWYVHEFDLAFNDGTNWNYSTSAPTVSQYDFETTSLHELGHAHGLNHIVSSGVFMHYSSSNGTYSRTLNTDMTNAGDDVMTLSTAAFACGGPAMTYYIEDLTTSATSSTICKGSSSTLSVSGASTYSWSPSATLSASTGSSVTATPTTTTTYTVTGTSGSCSKTATITITVNSLPTVTATATSTSVCSGTSVTLTGGGAQTYSWTGGISNGVAFTPTTTTTYTVTGTASNGCTNTATSTITVKSKPTVTATASSSSVCSGTSVTLTGGGAQTYTWTGGVTNAVAFTPTTTTTYTVTGTASNGCTNTASTTITVKSKPTVTASSTASSVCTGSSVTLSGGGAQTYAWTGGISNSVAFTPTTTTTYTVTGTASNGCTNTASTTVTVKSLPTVTASATKTELCSGVSTTLSGGGAQTYSWTGGVSDGVAFAPSTTQTYTVTGTASNSCTNTATITITVDSAPTVTASASTSTICNGDSVSLSGGGAQTYAWTNGVSDGVYFKPSSTQTYTVTGTATNGCTGTAQISIQVNDLPVVTASASTNPICSGDSVSLSGGGAQSYVWTSSVSDGVYFVPTTTNTYTVSGTDANGCKNTANITVTVNSIPTVTGSASKTNICSGDSVKLTGSGAQTYSWSGSVSDGVSFAPSSTQTYSVTGTSSDGCENTSTVTITVNALPSVSATSDKTVLCIGGTVILSGDGAQTYVWTGGVTDGVAFAPTATTTYTVTGTDGSGCKDNDQITITVNPLPSVSISASGPLGFCQGSNVTLTSSSSQSYAWSNGATTNAIIVSTSGTYSVTVTDANSCSKTSAGSTVTVNAAPVRANAINGSSVLCNGTTASYFLSPVSTATSYTWTVPSGTSIISGQGSKLIKVTAGSTSGSICVTADNICGSSLQSCKSIKVDAPATPGSISGASNLCTSGSSGLSYSIATVTGASSYNWTVPSGASIISGQGSKSVVVDFGSSTGDICVSSINSCGSSAFKCLSVGKTLPLKAGIIQGSENVCSAGTAGISYSVSAVTGATTYTWTAPSNASILSGQGTKSISASFSNSFASGNLCVTASNLCGSSVASCKALSDAPKQTAAISGLSNICGSSGDLTYSVPLAAGADSYNWQVPTDASIVSGQGTNSIVVSFSGSFSSGSICVSAVNTCGSGASRCLTVQKGLSTPGAISGKTSLCSGESNLIYKITALSGASSYQWTVPTGTSISSGQGTASIILTMGSTAGSVCVTATDGCGTTAARCLAIGVNSTPSAPTTITGPSSICETNKTYTSSSVSNATSYSWTAPTGASISSGQGTASVQINFNGATGNVCVSTTNTCGSSASKCIAVNNNPPSTPGSIVGSSNVCYAGTSTVNYSVSSVSGAGSYTWTVPSGASIVSGAGTNVLGVSYSNSFTSGMICVSASNTCSSSISSCKLITDAPVIYYSISGLAKVTAGATNVSYSIPAPAGTTSYLWTVPTGASIASGQGTNAIKINYDLSFISGDVCVSATNTCGTSAIKCISVSK